MGCRPVTEKYVLGVLYGENRPKSENWANLTTRSSAAVRRTEKLTRPRKLPGTWSIQRGVNSRPISLQWIVWPVACSEWGACLTIFDFRFLGQMTPKVKIFENIFPESATRHRNMFRDQIWWKSAVAKLPKGRLVCQTTKIQRRLPAYNKSHTLLWRTA